MRWGASPACSWGTLSASTSCPRGPTSAPCATWTSPPTTFSRWVAVAAAVGLRTSRWVMGGWVWHDGAFQARAVRACAGALPCLEPASCPAAAPIGQPQGHRPVHRQAEQRTLWQGAQPREQRRRRNKIRSAPCAPPRRAGAAVPHGLPAAGGAAPLAQLPAAHNSVRCGGHLLPPARAARRAPPQGKARPARGKGLLRALCFSQQRSPPLSWSAPPALLSELRLKGGTCVSLARAAGWLATSTWLLL